MKTAPLSPVLQERSASVVNRSESSHTLAKLDYSMIDPQLLGGTAPMVHPSTMVANAIEDEGYTTDTSLDRPAAMLDRIMQGAEAEPDMVDFATKPQLDAETESQISVLTAEHGHFITFFAEINIIRITALIKQQLSKAVRGGSRAEPTPFPFKCPNYIHGCSSVVNSAESLHVHLHTCPNTKEEHDRRKNRPYPCPETLQNGEACPKSFNGSSQLYMHIKEVHRGKPSFTPKSCPQPTCDSSVVYSDRHAWEHHQRDKHSGFTPMACPVSGCPSKTFFDAERYLEHHLRNMHGMDKDERMKVLPYKLQEAAKRAVVQTGWDSRKCPFPDCRSPTLFTNRAALQSHLARTHNFKKSSAPDTYDNYLGTKWEEEAAGGTTATYD